MGDVYAIDHFLYRYHLPVHYGYCAQTVLVQIKS